MANDDAYPGYDGGCKGVAHTLLTDEPYIILLGNGYCSRKIRERRVKYTRVLSTRVPWVKFIIRIYTPPGYIRDKRLTLDRHSNPGQPV